MEYIHSPIVGIAGAVFIFGLAILAHELGHFVLAKLNRVGVKEFAIGMGPQLFKFVKGETVYSIRAIPFGGFVMLEGAFPEDEEEKKEGESKPEEAKVVDSEKKKDVASSIMEDVNALRDKNMFAKISIFAAGVFFNFLAATFAVGLQSSIGVTQNEPYPAQFAEIQEATPMYEAGLRSLDLIREVDGKPAGTWDDFQAAIDQRIVEADSSPIQLTIERGGEKKPVTLPTPYDPENPKKHSAAYDNPEDPEYISLSPALPPYIDRMIPNHPAERAGIKRGDLIVAVNGVPVTYSFEVRNTIIANPGQAIEIEVRRGAETILCYPVTDDWEGKKTPAQIGVLFGMPVAEKVREPVLKAFAMAPKRTALFTAKIAGLTFETFHRLATDFRGTKKELAGPVGIITMAYKASRQGLERFMELFILLNLALLVFNLLPIPILDGGHIAICVIEGVTRRRIPPRVLAWTFTAMFVLLISFAILITYQDILTWWFKI